MAAQAECTHLQAYKYLHHLFYDVSFLIQKDNMNLLAGQTEIGMDWTWFLRNQVGLW